MASGSTNAEDQAARLIGYFRPLLQTTCYLRATELGYFLLQSVSRPRLQEFRLASFPSSARQTSVPFVQEFCAVANRSTLSPARSSSSINPEWSESPNLRQSI